MSLSIRPVMLWHTRHRERLTNLDILKICVYYIKRQIISQVLYLSTSIMYTTWISLSSIYIVRRDKPFSAVACTAGRHLLRNDCLFVVCYVFGGQVTLICAKSMKTVVKITREKRASEKQLKKTKRPPI